MIKLISSEALVSVPLAWIELIIRNINKFLLGIFDKEPLINDLYLLQRQSILSQVAENCMRQSVMKGIFKD